MTDRRRAVWMASGWAALALLLAPAGAAGADPIVLRLGTIAPEGSPWAEACETIRRTIARSTHRAIEIKFFLSGMLGDERQQMEAVAGGRLDLFAGSAAAMLELPELSAIEVPFLFHSDAEVDHVFARLWPLMRELVERRGYGLLGYSAVGFRHIGSKRRVQDLAALRALKLRSQPSPVHAALWAALGVGHTPLPLPQVVPALEAGSVDGFDSATVWMFASGWHPHIRFLTRTGHMFQPAIAIIGPGGLAKVPAAHRQAFLRIPEALSRENMRRVREVERGLIASLPEMGVTVEDVSPAFRAELAALARSARAAWMRTAGPAARKLLAAIDAELARFRAGDGPARP